MTKKIQSKEPFSKYKEQPFCNVALIPADHVLLKKLAKDDQRTMTRQLSVIIRKEHQRILKEAI